MQHNRCKPKPIVPRGMVSGPIGRAVSFDRIWLQHDIAVARDGTSMLRRKQVCTVLQKLVNNDKVNGE